MRIVPTVGWLLSFVVLQAVSAPVEYTIFTFKNGQQIGARKVKPVELRNAAIAITDAFQERIPPYEHMVKVAKGMTAKDRCFNLFSSKIALTSIEAGKLDASQYAQDFLSGSVSSIESVNSQTQVTCEMR